MLVAVLIAFVSRPYRQLSRAYAEAVPPNSGEDDEDDAGGGHSAEVESAPSRFDPFPASGQPAAE